MRYVYISLLAIAIAVILYLLLKPVPEYDTTKLKKYEKAYNRTVDSLRALRLADKEKLKQDSIKHLEARKKDSIQISSLKKLISIKKVPVQPIIDSNVDVRELVTFYDSTIVILETRIDSLNTKIEDNEERFKGMVLNYEADISASKSFIGQQADVIGGISKQNRKLKRQNTALKIGVVAIPLAVVALVVLK